MKIKYNWDYDRYVTYDGKVLRYDSKQDKLVLCKPCKSRYGYCRIRYKGKTFQAHRVIFETFVGKIPQGYEIDHINTVSDDNRLENLRLVTHQDNCSLRDTPNIFLVDKEGNVIKTFSSYVNAAKATGFGKETLRKNLKDSVGIVKITNYKQYKDYYFIRK